MESRATRRFGMPILAFATLLLAMAQSVAAHEAPAPREIDTAVLTDDDGLLEYGGCAQEQCLPAGTGGIDLLGLDLREAALADGSACLVFRVLFAQPATASTERTMRITFEVDGQVQTLDIAGPETDSPSAPAADRIEGPATVGEGMLALDVWARSARFGLESNGTLQDIRVRSLAGTQPDDDMPGPWYQDGIAVPHVPHDPGDPGEAVEEHPAGRYVLSGPASLLVVDAGAAPVLGRVGLAIRFSNPLATLAQDVALVLEGTGAASVALDLAAFSLQPGAVQTVLLTPGDALPQGELRLVASTDLGGWETVALPIAAATVATPSSSAMDDTGSRGSPAPFALVVLALAVAARRRTS